MAAKLEFHPAASLFPLLTGDDFAEMVSSVKSVGLQLPILIYKGKILDGRNRYNACLKAGIEPWTAEADLDGMTPTEFVWALNGPRRHLTTSQRAMIGAEMRKQFDADAAERMKAGKAADPSQNSSTPPGRASEVIGKAVGVSDFSIDAATKVKEQGSAALQAAVERGEVSVSAAAVVADAPKLEQTMAVKAGPAAVKALAKEMKADKKPTEPKPTKEPKPRNPSGKEVGKMKREAKKALGVVIRALDDLGLIKKYREALDSITKELS